jgi:parallel beta-helix repeat protein
MFCPGTSARAIDCAVPPDTSSGHVFYVDPQHGSMANDGSATSPWSTLQAVVADGRIATQVYVTPYRQDGGLRAVNPGGQVHPGDTIYLRTGDHGDVELTGVNSRYITITAERGQRPIIDHLATYGASNWIIRGLTFQHEGGGWLVQFLNHNFRGPSNNIVFESNTLYANIDVSRWTSADWKARGVNGIMDSASCSTIRYNRLVNVLNGISISGANSRVQYNLIDNFADDGIDFGASDLSIIGNRITNNHAIGDGNHNDAIQGWTFDPDGQENVLISGNLIMNAAKPDLVLPGNMQGISIFDGKWRDVRVIGNTVLTNVWHGIALYGVRDSKIEGNTVLATDPTRTTWIRVTDMKAQQGGAPPRNVIVRHNLATRYTLPDNDNEATNDGNVTDIEP